MNFANPPQGSMSDTPFYTNKQGPNVIDGAGEFMKAFKASHPTEKVSDERHIFVIDSRQRDCKLYPSPSFYRIPVGDIYKNVNSIELMGCMLPKTSYNVHSSNNNIDFNIGDSVTFINVIDSGSGYTSAPSVFIASPSGGGVQATATANIDPIKSNIVSITINIPGSGYSQSLAPIIIIGPPNTNGGVQATAVASVGITYTATLRVGQYTLGGNPEPGVTTEPSGLVNEIQNSLNYAVNGGVYDPSSTSPFAVRVVSQYPTLDANPGSPDAFQTNACQFNRLQITNVNSDPWELLWCSGKHSEQNARAILGFPWLDQINPTLTTAINVAGGELIPEGMTYRGDYDYDLQEDPKYAILRFWALSDENFERVESKSGGGIDRAFATLIFDANNADVYTDLSGTEEDVAGVNYLVGDVAKGPFWKPAGPLKALKGHDFDKKYLEFSPPIGKLSSLNIAFTKFGVEPGGVPNMYDFEGRDHLLIFSFSSTDQAGAHFSGN